MTKKEFVSMSLPYGLKVLIPESNTKGCRKTVVGTVGVVFDDGSISCYDAVNEFPKWHKPILYPMSYQIDLRSKSDWYDFCEIHDLIKSHFDVDGLIAKGQAIDVNSLKVNPYSGKVNPYKNK